MPIYNAQKKGKLFLGATKIKKAYLGATLVYSAGNIVTYIVDSGTSYREEFDEGESVLSPKTFTPAKTGWTFVGWRLDTAASSAVQTYITMGDTPITLYAVFRQTITVTYYNGSTTASSVAKERYYNNGTVANPSFTLHQAAISGWSARGWSGSSAANGSILYANGATFTRDSNIAIYGAYQQTITLYYAGNGNTGGATAAQTGIRYWNTGNVANPTFTVRPNGFTRTGYTFQRWRLNSLSGTIYAAGSSITLAASDTLYAEWALAEITLVDTSGNINSNYLAISGGTGVMWSARAYIHDQYNGTQRGQTVTVTLQLQNMVSSASTRFYFATRGENGYSDRIVKVQLRAKDGGKAAWEIDSNVPLNTGRVEYVTVLGNGTIQFELKADITDDYPNYTWCSSIVKLLAVVSPAKDLSIAYPW